jgi:hypothetical protein
MFKKKFSGNFSEIFVNRAKKLLFISGALSRYPLPDLDMQNRGACLAGVDMTPT